MVNRAMAHIHDEKGKHITFARVTTRLIGSDNLITMGDHITGTKLERSPSAGDAPGRHTSGTLGDHSPYLAFHHLTSEEDPESEEPNKSGE